MAMRVLLLSMLLAVRMELPGCGPFLPKALFTLSHQPERPDTEFARGRLGVLLPGYTRDYLIVAYRYLAGVGLNDAARSELFPPPLAPEQRWQPRRNPWLEARNQVPGVKPVASLDVYRTVQSPNTFEIYPNCGDDALRAAATTLARLTRKHGVGSLEVKEWIGAQDQVFTNCSAGPAIPAPTGAPDRAYQVAAAKFYARQFDAAREDFDAIAQDPASPWRGIAPYLVARCLIRKGDFDAAQQQLEGVANDPALAEWHGAARRLMGYVRAKAHPIERLHELAAAVVRPDSPTLARDSVDYHFLLDHLEKAPLDDDITDWILTFQSGTAAHAVESWRATRSVPWLVAALTKVEAGDDAVADLLVAVREVKPDSPAYATVAFHAARLSAPDESRRIADAALGTPLPVSARNLFRAERMRAATGFDDFLRFAARTAVGVENDQEEPDAGSGRYIDADAARILNRHVPLSLLKRASERALLPESVRRDLREVVWVRSVLLAAQPPDPEDVLRLLRSPGLKPYVDAGLGRSIQETGKIESFRDNWWCAIGTEDHWFYDYPRRIEMSDALARLYGKSGPAAPFLSAAEQAEAGEQWERLKSVPTAPNWLASQVLDWAGRKPDDARLPEALHLAVRATRYGCADQRSGEYSKRAFEQLHRRFPASEWAKKTPYWYGSGR
jgi:hypothetical protein